MRTLLATAIIAVLLGSCASRERCSAAGTWLVIDAPPECAGEGCSVAAFDRERDSYTVTVNVRDGAVHWLEPGLDGRRIERRGTLDPATCEIVIAGAGTGKDSAVRRLRVRDGAFRGSRVQVGAERAGIYVLSWHSEGARF
jgi:hypothetical protein